MNKKDINFFKKKISRREFIKYCIVGVATLSFGSYIVKKYLFNKKSIETTTELWKWSKEAYHYIKFGDAVRCQLCPNRCLIKEGERSFCRVKTNKNGKLYTLAYGNPCAIHIDPIEKKPLFHFLPGTKAFSIATAGCNFRCLNCQNWTISQFRPEDTKNYDLMPNQVVDNALKYNCETIAYTYSEPVAFYEYMYDTAKLASEHNIKNLWITNGYINTKPLKDLCNYIDAANVDLKSFKDDVYTKLNAGSLKPVLDTLKTLKDAGVWFEVTNLVVPTWTDDLDMITEMCKWLKQNIGVNYPLHFSRFFPMYKLTHLPPTPIDVLEKAREIALDVGLNYVYIGNVPKHQAQNTYCPKCGKILIEREGYSVIKINLDKDNCKFCGEKIAGVWA